MSDGQRTGCTAKFTDLGLGLSNGKVILTKLALRVTLTAATPMRADHARLQREVLLFDVIPAIQPVGKDIWATLPGCYGNGGAEYVHGD